jgi:hypothetical protein
MGESACYCCPTCAGEMPLAASGITSDCLRVQMAVRNLAEYLSAADLDHNLLPLTLQAVQQTRQDLGEHVAAIEGPAGLFQYLATSAPYLAEQIMGLSWQHQDLDKRLDELEQLLGRYNAGDGSALVPIHRCAGRLLEALRQHQGSAGQLKMAAYEA